MYIKVTFFSTKTTPIRIIPAFRFGKLSLPPCAIGGKLSLASIPRMVGIQHLTRVYSLKETWYHPYGILILYYRVLECISHMCETYTNNFDTSHVAYLEIDPKNEEGLELAIRAIRTKRQYRKIISSKS